jgi:CubicO group peptidase (beta-lactamase class C family)
MLRSDIGVGNEEVVSVLSAVRARHELPAITAAIVGSTGLLAVGAVGTRKWGTDSPVSLDDVWHLGSDTKIVTSAVVALLVEQGILKWTTTVSDVFPELADVMHPRARKITILQLLSHCSGIQANTDYDAFNTSMPVREQRIEAAKIALVCEPTADPGTRFLYSNLGYIIAGAIIERVLNMDWEQAVIQRVFEPLGMSSGGFGGLGTTGLIDQPWGHEARKRPFGRNGPDADNPPVMGPAGRIHCTIQDWARFIADQLRGAQGIPGLLSRESYAELQSPHFVGDYCLGWGVMEREWAGGKALTHVGCNTLFLALAWIAPAKDVAFLVCTNEGVDSAPGAEEAVAGLVSTKLVLLR